MFDFENLDVYKKAKELNKEVLKFIKENKHVDSYLRNQLPDEVGAQSSFAFFVWM